MRSAGPADRNATEQSGDHSVHWRGQVGSKRRSWLLRVSWRENYDFNVNGIDGRFSLVNSPNLSQVTQNDEI